MQSCLITIPEGKHFRADHFKASAYDANAMHQRMYWVALQMSQEEWLKEELHRVDRKIEAKEQQLLGAREANKSIPIIY